MNNYPPQAVSCPSTSLCVAVGVDGRIYSSTDPTGGRNAWRLTWTCSTPGDCAQDLTAVSCSSRSLCVGVDQQGDVITSTDPTGGTSAWTITSVDPSCTSPRQCPGALSGVSCPSTSLCVSVDKAGNVVSSTNPTGGASAWSVAKVGDEFNAISCGSPQLCVAVGAGGDAAASTNPAGGAGAWTVNDADGSNALQAISCPSAQLCVAVDNYGNAVSSTAPAASAGTWRVVNMDGTNSLSAVSCPSSLLCVAVGGGSLGQVDTTTNPGARKPAWRGTRLTNTQGLTAVSCPSRSLCLAVDTRGDVVTSTDPTGGASAWRVAKIANPTSPNPRSTAPLYTSFADISCASTSLCVAVGSSGCITIPDQSPPPACQPGAIPNLYVSTDPAGGPSAWRPTVLGGGQPLSAISCPSTRLCVAIAQRSILTASHPSRGAKAWKRASTPYYLLDVACPTTRLCIAPSDGTNSSPLGYLLTSRTPATTTRWKASPLAPSQSFNKVTCTSALFCLASDEDGHIFASSYPTAGAAWTTTFADPRLGPLALACASQSFCVGIDPQGSAVIGTGPAPPTRKAIKALLAREIKPRPGAATTQALLRHKRYTLTFRTLTAGNVTISWSFRSTRTKTGSRAQMVIATGAGVLLRPGITRISLKLTARGRQLIKHLGVSKFVAKGKLTRPDGSALLASSAFTLRP